MQGKTTYQIEENKGFARGLGEALLIGCRASTAWRDVTWEMLETGRGVPIQSVTALTVLSNSLLLLAWHPRFAYGRTVLTPEQAAVWLSWGLLNCINCITSWSIGRTQSRSSDHAAFR